MFHKIVVAINASAISMQALDEAIALAKATHAQLKLIHVLDDRDPDQPQFPYPTEYQAYSAFNVKLLDDYQKQYEAFVAKSLTWINAQAQRAMDEGIITDYEQPTGIAGKHICAHAEHWGADLIIVGSRCLKGFRELLLGSVSNYVVHHAKCSVCVIHPHEHQSLSINSEITTDSGITTSTSASANTMPRLSL